MNLEDLRTRCPLFDGIGAEDFEAVMGCLAMTRRAYGDGDRVFREGERDAAVGIVLSVVGAPIFLYLILSRNRGRTV